MTRASDARRKLLAEQRADAELERIYASLPELDCKGLCTDSCGPIDMTDRERARIRWAGYRISFPRDAVRKLPEFRCEALTEDGRCAVYELRPLICRLYGLTQSMRCEHGCQPRPRVLSDGEAGYLLTAAMLAGGHEAVRDAEPGDALRAAEQMRTRPARREPPDAFRKR